MGIAELPDQEGQTIAGRVVQERAETKASYSDLPDSPLLGRGVYTLCVIIPAKNDERSLPPLIGRLFFALRAIGRRARLCVGGVLLIPRPATPGGHDRAVLGLCPVICANKKSTFSYTETLVTALKPGRY
jgi:hypothetical protein